MIPRALPLLILSALAASAAIAGPEAERRAEEATAAAGREAGDGEILRGERPDAHRRPALGRHLGEKERNKRAVDRAAEKAVRATRDAERAEERAVRRVRERATRDSLKQRRERLRDETNEDGRRQ